MVGTNVASDALSNLSSAGVTGGALIIVGEDYGDGASIIQERTHAFAMKSQVWLLDPRPNLPTIVKMVEHGFALSEASNSPVMLELRIRACHVHGSFVCKDNISPAISRRHPIETPLADLARFCLPPWTYAQERNKIDTRWPAAVDYITRHQLNEVMPGRQQRHRHRRAGRTVQRRDSFAAAAGARRRLWRERDPDLRAQRHLSAGAVGSRRLLQGQGLHTDGGGGAAELSRAGDSCDSAGAQPHRPCNCMARIVCRRPANIPARSC